MCASERLDVCENIISIFLIYPKQEVKKVYENHNKDFLGGAGKKNSFMYFSLWKIVENFLDFLPKVLKFFPRSEQNHKKNSSPEE